MARVSRCCRESLQRDEPHAYEPRPVQPGLAGHLPEIERIDDVARDSKCGQVQPLVRQLSRTAPKAEVQSSPSSSAPLTMYGIAPGDCTPGEMKWASGHHG